MVENKVKEAFGAVAAIRYKTPEGVPGTWEVACRSSEGEAEMRKHLAHWHPQYEFLGCTITPVGQKAAPVTKGE